jgi:hypothetical protein
LTGHHFDQQSNAESNTPGTFLFRATALACGRCDHVDEKAAQKGDRKPADIRVDAMQSSEFG